MGPGRLPVAPTPIALTSEDWNLDGLADVAVMSRGQPLTVFWSE